MPAPNTSGASGATFVAVALVRVLLWMLVASFAPARAASIDIIVSPDRSGTPLDRDTVRAMFTTRLRQWPDGAPVRVFVLPDDSPQHDLFCREQLGIYPYVLRQLWDRLQFTGTGLPPTVVRSESEMRDRVHDTPGAIGYVTSGDSRYPGAPASAPPPHLLKVPQ